MMEEFKRWLEEYSHGEMISQRYELRDAYKGAMERVLKVAKDAGEWRVEEFIEKELGLK